MSRSSATVPVPSSFSDFVISSIRCRLPDVSFVV